MFDNKSQKIGNVTSSGKNSGNHIVQNSNSHNNKIPIKWIIGAITFIISVLGIISSSSDGGFLNHIIFKNNSDNTNITTNDISKTPKN